MKAKILLALFFFLLCRTSLALVVFDPQVFARLGSELMQMQQQVQLLQQQLNAIKTLTPGQYQWGNAQQLINQLGEAVQKTNGLAYNATNLGEQFQRAYPGHEAPEDFSTQYKNNTGKALNTLNGALQSLGLNAQDFANENKRLAFLQQQAQSAKGQTQAIQASAQIASEMVSQLQLLRQTVITQANAQGVYYATQLQNEASARAELAKIIQTGATEVPAYGASGHALEIPDF